MTVKAKRRQRIEQRVLRCSRVSTLVSRFAPIGELPGNAVYRTTAWQGTDTVFVNVYAPQDKRSREVYRAFLTMLHVAASGRIELTDEEVTDSAPLCSATAAELRAVGIPPDFVADLVSLWAS